MATVTGTTQRTHKNMKELEVECFSVFHPIPFAQNEP